MFVRPNLAPSVEQLRQFGWVAFAAFGGIGLVVTWRGGLFGLELGGWASTATSVLWALGLLSALFSIWSPRANRPLFVLLSVIALPIALVVSHVAMALLFFGVLTPVALIFRLVGRDALARRWERDRRSYWSDAVDVTDKKDYFHQY